MDKAKLLDDLILIFSKLVLPTCEANSLNCTIYDYLNARPYLGYLFELIISELKSETFYHKLKSTM